MSIQNYLLNLQPEINKIGIMTALARKLQTTPMAPYFGLQQGMSREDKKIVIMFLTESLAETEEKTSSHDVVVKVREHFKVPESEETKWFREHSAKHEWSREDAWNRLADGQRKEASEKLNLTAEDMDERTFEIIQKHLK